MKTQSEIEAALSRPKTRGITLHAKGEARGEPAGPADAAPAINLNVPFELGSSELRGDATRQLEQLESALKSPALSAQRFVIAGHTDARGDAERNRELSVRRAFSVCGFLVGHGIDSKRLECVGYGEERLLTPDTPESAVNRRVEIRLDASPAGEKVSP